MKEREISNELLSSKFVVYSDERYPTSWISIKNAKDIAKYLQTKGFHIFNADELKIWMENAIKSNNAKGRVVVFSQDVVPSTVFFDKTDNHLKEYLSAGGNVIWVGDIPFAYRGYKDYEVDIITITYPNGNKSYQHRITRDKLQPLGINDQIVMLGLVSAFGFSQNKTILTKSGKRQNILHTYYGMRPVHLNFITNLSERIKNFIFKGNKMENWEFENVLAVSKLEPPIVEEQITPHKVKEEKEIIFTPLSDFGVLVKKILSIIVFLLGISSSIYLFIKGFLLSSAILEILFLAGLYYLYWHTYHLCYANEWIKKFPNEGKFVRLWDYRPERITDRMKEELYNVAKSNLES